MIWIEVAIAIILALTLVFHVFTHWDRNWIRLDHRATIKGRDIWVYITNRSKIDIVIENITFAVNRKADGQPDYTFQIKPNLSARLKPGEQWQGHYTVEVKFVEKCQDIRLCKVKLTSGKNFTCDVERLGRS